MLPKTISIAQPAGIYNATNYCSAIMFGTSLILPLLDGCFHIQEQGGVKLADRTELASLDPLQLAEYRA